MPILKFSSPLRFVAFIIACLCTIIPLSTVASASPTVTVISPKTGSSAGSPVFFEAYATSAGCANGISAMRIYTAPGVNAFTTSGAHIEHFLTLQPGSYATVVQAWDNCGGVGKTAVNLTVHSTAGVSVFLPNQASAEWPVHIAASAQNSSCSTGISALRIYTASGVTPYTIDSNALDAYINLVPGTYGLTIQAWDNCGHVFKSQLAESVTAGPDAYVYAATYLFSANRFGLAELAVNSDGTLKNPNGSGSVPFFSPAGLGPNTVVVDPGGWFVYVSSNNGIYGFQINRTNGALSVIPGSPFPLNQALGDQGPPPIVMDPTGNFIYLYYRGFTGVDGLATYRIHRSSGALSWTGWARRFENKSYPTPCGLVEGVTTNFTGQYVYVSALPDGCGNLQIYGFKADPDHGFLNSQVPGSPYPVDAAAFLATAPVSAGRYLYLSDQHGNTGTGAETWAFGISRNTGTLAQVSGSPFLAGDKYYELFADWRTRFLWAWNDKNLQALAIDPSTGEITLSGGPQLSQTFSSLVEDHTGKYAFVSKNIPLGTGADTPEMSSFAISSGGTLTPLNSVPISSSNGQIGSVAVARKNPI